MGLFELPMEVAGKDLELRKRLRGNWFKIDAAFQFVTTLG
jgi:hypothetical protein